MAFAAAAKACSAPLSSPIAYRPLPRAACACQRTEGLPSRSDCSTARRSRASRLALLRHQSRRRSELVCKWCSNLTRIHLDNVRLQRAKDRQELVLFGAGDLELIQRRDKILDQGTELTFGDLHPGMCFLHAPSVISTRTARSFADLVDEHLCQSRKVRPRELQVYPVVSGHPVPEVFDDRCDRADSTKSLEQRPFHGSSPVQSCFWSSVPPAASPSPRLLAVRATVSIAELALASTSVANPLASSTCL